MLEFFDFHFHAVFKAYISQVEDQYPTSLPAECFTEPIDLVNPLSELLFDNPTTIESQSCIEQLQQGNVSLGVTNIAPIERVFTRRTSPGGILLNSPLFTAPLKHKVFKQIRKGKTSYYQIFIKELQIHRLLAEKGFINLLSRKAPSTLQAAHNFAFAIEGGHALARNLVGRKNRKDSMKVTASDKISEDFEKHPLLRLSDSLKHLHAAMWEMDMDIFSLVLTHLSHIPENNMATHAYGIKFLKDRLALPQGFGITKEGYKLIDTAYTMKSKKEGETIDTPVLIDIKHMSYETRKQFYAYRKGKYDHIPIIASHMGVTGYDIDNWKGASSYKRKRKKECFKVRTSRKIAGVIDQFTFSFNPWSINLMDNDIVEVVKSGGLIGVSLDTRILGFGKHKKRVPEFISDQDFRAIFKPKPSQIEEEPDEAEETESLELSLNPDIDRSDRHELYFCFNILHIVAVIQKNFSQLDPWDFICIGSDFDGLISPLKSCEDWTHSSKLKTALEMWLPIAEEAYREVNHVNKLLPSDLNVFQASIDKFLFQNGKRFLTERGFIVPQNTPPV